MSDGPSTPASAPPPLQESYSESHIKGLGSGRKQRSTQKNVVTPPRKQRRKTAPARTNDTPERGRKSASERLQTSELIHVNAGLQEETSETPANKPREERRGNQEEDVARRETNVQEGEEQEEEQDEILDWGRKYGENFDSSMSYGSIVEFLRQPIPQDKQKLGKVYIFQHPRNPSHLKVGSSSSGVNYRMKQIESKCILPGIKTIYTSGTMSSSWAKKVERLVHLELMYFQLDIDCGCDSKHREFFEISHQGDVETDSLAVHEFGKAVLEQTIVRWHEFLQEFFHLTNKFDESLISTIMDFVNEHTPSEDHHDHQARHYWWQRLFDRLKKEKVAALESKAATSSGPAMSQTTVSHLSNSTAIDANGRTVQTLNEANLEKTNMPIVPLKGTFNWWQVLAIIQAMVLLCLASSNWCLEYFLKFYYLVMTLAALILYIPIHQQRMKNLS